MYLFSENRNKIKLMHIFTVKGILFTKNKAVKKQNEFIGKDIK